MAAVAAAVAEGATTVEGDTEGCSNGDGERFEAEIPGVLPGTGKEEAATLPLGAMRPTDAMDILPM